MKTVLEIAFKDSAEAARAAKVLKSEPLGAKAKVGIASKGEVLVVTVSAADFSTLRARTTSIFRDLRVFFAVGQAVEDLE